MTANQRVLSLLLFAAGCASPAPTRDVPESGRSVDPPAEAARAAPLRLVDLDGVSHALAGEEPLVLVFWQTWCQSCIAEAPELVAAAREHAGELRFLGVVPGPDEYVDEAEVRAKAAEMELPYPQVRDRDLALSRRFDVKGTPTIVVLGASGELLWRGHRSPEDWRRIIEGDDRAADAGRGGDLPGAAPVSAQDPALSELVSRSRREPVMGTELSIEVLGTDAEALERALDAAILEIRRVEDLMTSWRPSPLTELNGAAGEGPREVPGELARLVARGLRVGELTGGAFDVTFASVGRLWDFKREPPLVPSAEEVAAALERVGYDKVEVDLEASTVALPEGTRIGLGGIAKGYGVDRAMAVLMEHGVEHALVNAGGDLKALGTKRGKPWRIAIRHPRDEERVLASIPVSNTCLVTSGDYERFFELDGVRYHHILDPRTGYPSTGCISATVIAPDAAFADALATALCVLGPERGLELVEGLERVEALLVGMDGEVHASPGLKGARPR